ncbi:hypothetical protein GCM10023191_064900 [Actinoallomurus oryzae]|uniref:Aminoglycoside phosphotransferase domain-containing protein n=1 Tax=Actinoallomurus oryzae TaxID=502180 RepID=A0ABP8QR89_9ACTN
MDEPGFEQDLVRALLREQHPDLADLELRDVVGGWDNQQWRLGAEPAVRLPRTERAPALLRTEQKWPPVLAERLPLPTPAPVRVGEPSALFGHTWTIMRWVEGEPADRAPITRADAAETLAGFLRALHRRAPRKPRPAPRAASRRRGYGTGSPGRGGRGRRRERRCRPRDLGEGRRGARVGRGADLAARRSASRERGRAALHLISIGRNGRLGLPGGKPTWEPAGRAALERALAVN